MLTANTKELQLYEDNFFFLIIQIFRKQPAIVMQRFINNTNEVLCFIDKLLDFMVHFSSLNLATTNSYYLEMNFLNEKNKKGNCASQKQDHKSARKISQC